MQRYANAADFVLIEITSSLAPKAQCINRQNLCCLRAQTRCIPNYV